MRLTPSPMTRLVRLQFGKISLEKSSQFSALNITEVREEQL